MQLPSAGPVTPWYIAQCHGLAVGGGMQLSPAQPRDPESSNTDGNKKGFCLMQDRKGNFQFIIAALFVLFALGV